MTRFSLSIIALLATTAIARAGIDASPIPLENTATVLAVSPEGRDAVLITTREDKQIHMAYADGKLQLRQENADGITHSEDAPPPAKTIPGARPGRGANTVESAWLTQPTKRYVHGILGDNVEAGALLVRLKDGRAFEYRLPETSVFEDIEPRVADLDGDGADEIVTIRSEPELGARMSIFRADANGLSLVVETPPVALPFDWILPVGAADFDGDGVGDIAVVISPHLRKLLRIYRFDGKTLENIGGGTGFSNHIPGSTTLTMGAMMDANHDGLADLVLPSADRRTLRVVSFAGGALQDLDNIPLPAPVATAIVPVGPLLVFGLENGALYSLGQE
ncbi:MAG TPA: hypothetical protein DCW68_02895 [Rhodospirillaceae bacterium]|nr:MAG: hypothetical protein A2018_05870 [Alphaproteobacteria bacterium GWF2_58_20]HAU29039.1 hypothetical protein [Rhodospirillaceae bacterium]